MTEHNLKKKAEELARQLLGDDSRKRASFTQRLLDLYNSAQKKDFLLLHNPGGWGNTPMARIQHWERSIVEGIAETIERLGYSVVLRQYFRTGKDWRETMSDIREQARFFATKAKIMAAELRFITQYSNTLKIIMIGVSQGAAFSNAVLQHSHGLDRIHSVELGLPFPYKSRRVITANTLAIDSNGLMPDALMEWDIPTILKAFSGAPFRWIKYQLQRKPRKFTYCINVPGHEYNWEYPEVQRQIIDFLKLNFDTKSDVEVSVS
jgi:hypothetical protein